MTYLPPHFVENDPAALHALVRAYPLATWVVQHEGELLVNHIPMLLDAERGEHGTLVGHVARANPVWQRPAGTGAAAPEALVVFQGPEGYISPNGYASKREHGKVVPTWNYAVVQARGPLVVLDEAAATHALVSQLTARHEASQTRPWAVKDAPADYIASMLKAIVCIEIPLTALVGKYKLSQNRTALDRAGLVAALQTGASPAEHELARWMQAPDGNGT